MTGLLEPRHPLPVPADNHPVPSQEVGPPLGDRIEFLLFGYRRTDGTVQLYASTEIPWAELKAELREDRWSWTYDLTARLLSWQVATGPDMRSALASLTELWRDR